MGLPAYLTRRLQSVLNLRRSDHVSDAINSLQWLRVRERIRSKVAVLSSTAVHRRILARSLTLPTFQVAEGFALPAATASSSLRFTVPLLAAEHFRLLALLCGTACHWRLSRHRRWRPSALNSRRFFLLSHILTFG